MTQHEKNHTQTLIFHWGGLKSQFILFSNFFFFLSEHKMLIKSQVTSELQWLSEMDVDVNTSATRKTSIIGTIGNY